MRVQTKGSVLVEGCITLALTALMVIIQVELVRRIWSGTLLQLAAFETVRGKVLGLESFRLRGAIHDLLWPMNDWAQSQMGGLNLHKLDYIVPSNEEAVNKYHLKYPSLISIAEKNGLKKFTYEVTEQCRFPYSLH